MHTNTPGPVSGQHVDSGKLSGGVSAMGGDRNPNSIFSRLLPPEQAHHLPIEFTGSGSEYFRLWAVNLLLTLVTLGIYYPWAKVRRLRYFYRNTLVAGHALDFHGEPKKMLRGSALAGLLFIVYSQALDYSPLAGLVGAVLVSALWPLLLRAALQFRTAHTSWRGMRFGFVGGTAEAYQVLAVPLALSLMPLALLAYADTAGAGTKEQPASFTGGLELGPLMMVAAVVLFLLTLPYFYWRLKKYQHNHYRLGQLQSELRLGPMPVYGVVLRTLGLFLLPAVVAGLIAGVLHGGVPGLDRSSSWLFMLLVFFGVIFIVGGLYFYLVVLPYFTVRMQNLVWTKTGNRYLRFRSDLKFGRYLGLQIKNYLLVLLTLGLYWPWAAVANRRMRLEAITLVSRVDLDDLIMAIRPKAGDAAADMGDELMGLDVGF
jgi:uncharacterized membrane protein YjgN (DUF898 family)